MTLGTYGADHIAPANDENVPLNIQPAKHEAARQYALGMSPTKPLVSVSDSQGPLHSASHGSQQMQQAGLAAAIPTAFMPTHLVQSASNAEAQHHISALSPPVTTAFTSEPGLVPLGVRNTNSASTSPSREVSANTQAGLPTLGVLEESAAATKSAGSAAGMSFNASLELHGEGPIGALPAYPSDSRIPTPFTQAGVFQSPVKLRPAPEHRILPSDHLLSPPAPSQIPTPSQLTTLTHIPGPSHIPAPSQSAALLHAAATSDSHLSELAAEPDLRRSDAATSGLGNLGIAQGNEVDGQDHAYAYDEPSGAALQQDDHAVRGRAMAR